MARVCGVENCERNVFGTDRITRIGYCMIHQGKRTDLKRRNITRSKKTKISKETSKVKDLMNTEQNKEMAEKNLPNRERDFWFEQRGKEMTGTCINCGERSCKGQLGKCVKCGGENFSGYRGECLDCGEKRRSPMYQEFSICHIFPKKLFPSVASHPLNWWEGCYFGNSCHTNADSNGFGYIKDKMPVLWEFIVKQAIRIYPDIAPHERVNIPHVLMTELDNLN